MNNNDIFTDTGRDLVTKIVTLWDKIPMEKRYFLLGYMQSEADKNIETR